jgi:GNAT superfamily N-acetyltransferase
MEGQHTQRCRRLWEKRFGTTEDHADEWLEDARLESDKPTQGFVAVIGGNVVGFGIATVGSREYAQDYLDPADVEVWDQTGILHILVVAAGHEGRRIGSRLVETRLRWLANVTEAKGVVGISWHRENHRDSRSLFEKYNFEAAETVEKYYDKLEGETACPDCELAGECYCDATAYRRSLGDWGGATLDGE